MTYKVIIAGSRHITDMVKIGPIIEKKMESILDEHGWDNVEIVSGGAQGIDRIGELFASSYSLRLTKFPADWAKYGKSAGPIRNKEMGKYADMALVIWDGISPGSKNMIETMKKLNKPVIAVVLDL